MNQDGAAALYNCSFTSTDDVNHDFADPFCFAFSASAHGIGVGFDTEGVGKCEIVKPKYSDNIVVIDDSREGWVDALRMVLDAYTGLGTIPKFDYSKIRPFGSKIKRFGGTASGPESLKELLEVAIPSILTPSKLTSTQIVDLMDVIGRCVVAGGARRSALLAMGSIDDNEFINLKMDEVKVKEFRWASNNSVNCPPDYNNFEQFINSIMTNGEPGFIMLENCKNYSRMDGIPDYKDQDIQGVNPCITGDTLVYVADGRGCVSIKELAESNRDVKVFCFDSMGKVAIKTMFNPRITGNNEKIYKVTLDDGSSIKTTKNHKFRLKSGEYKECCDLQYGDSLDIVTRFQASMREITKTKKAGNGDYWWINHDRRNNAEHRIIAQASSEISINSKVIHHKDHDSLNNTPSNKEEWIAACKKSGVSHEISRKSSPFRSYNILITEASAYNHKVVSVEFIGYDTVYNGTVEEYHNFFIGGFESKTKSGKNKQVFINSKNCGEIPLNSRELCNICELFPSRCENFEEFKRAIKYAYLYAKTVTLTKTPWARTNEIMLRNRRIGLSMSGIIENINKRGFAEHIRWCKEGYHYVEELDITYSRWLCIPYSLKKTTVKPSGTVSLLPQVTPGIHYPHSEYYIRNIRMTKGSTLLGTLEKAGYLVEDDVYDKTVRVVSFPIHEKYFKRSKKDITIWEQLENAAQMQEYWSDNAVSITVTVKPEERSQLVEALERYQSRLKTVSFLPLKDHNYKQAPYIEIDEKKYLEMVSKISEVDFSSTKHEVTEKFCDSESCSI
jgi:hypothetical protein